MRSKKALINIIFALLYEVFIVIMGIIFPKLIIETYGSDVNGLTSTINNVLSILNLIQAGAVGASIFQMFKPVAENDYDTQGKVLGSSKIYFCKIGLVFLLLVIVTAPVLAFAISSGTIGLWEKIIAFALLGINGSLSFFFISNYDILFSSNQKRFLLSIGGLIDKIIYYGLLFVILFLKLNYLSMYFVTILGTFSKIVFLYIAYCSTYKKLIKYKYVKGYKIPNKGYLMINQIARQSIDGSPTIIISMIGGLGVASVYSIYNIVFNMIKTLSSTFQTSINEIFGNVVVSDTKDKVKRTYESLNYLFFIISIVLCGCLAFLFRSFIFIYTNGNSLDINYMYNTPTLLFAIYGVFFVNYHPIYTLTNVLGYYQDTYLQSAVTAIAAVIISVVLSFVNWSLVIVGLIFYFFVSYIYRTYIVYKKTKNEYISLKSSIIHITVSLLVVICIWTVSYLLFTDYKCSWLWWFVVSFITLTIITLFTVVYSLIFEKKQFENCLSYIKTVIGRR